MRVRSLSRRVRTPSLRRWCSGNTRRLARTSCSVSPTSPSGTTFQPRPRTPMSRFLCVGDLPLPPPSILPSVSSDRYASSSSLNLNFQLTEGQGSVRLRLSWRGTPLTPRQSSQNGHALTVSTSAGAVPASPSSVGRAQSIRSPSKFFSRKSKDAPDLS
jgi:hypothetical protein